MRSRSLPEWSPCHEAVPSTGGAWAQVISDPAMTGALRNAVPSTQSVSCDMKHRAADERPTLPSRRLGGSRFSPLPDPGGSKRGPFVHAKL